MLHTLKYMNGNIYRVKYGEAIMTSDGIDMTIKGDDAGSTAMLGHGGHHDPLVGVAVIALHCIEGRHAVVAATHVQLVIQHCSSYSTKTQRNSCDLFAS